MMCIYLWYSRREYQVVHTVVYHVVDRAIVRCDGITDAVNQGGVDSLAGISP